MDAVFNRPPAISEDCLQYTLYLAPGARDQASAAALAAVLQAHVDARLPGHIWHRDAFQLKLARDPDASDEEYTLEGRMRVGDCVDDEWCVVWLLREISAKWDMVIRCVSFIHTLTYPRKLIGLCDVINSVCDSDGEFLLIEAADALPSWVNPTNAENRVRVSSSLTCGFERLRSDQVWIYASRLHLIPLLHASPPSSKRRRSRYPSARDSDNEDVTGADDEDFISVSDALRLVRDVDVDTEAPTNVQTAVWRRIDRHVLRCCRGRVRPAKLTPQIPRSGSPAYPYDESLAAARHCAGIVRRPVTCAEAHRNVLHAGRYSTPGLLSPCVLLFIRSHNLWPRRRTRWPASRLHLPYFAPCA
jgi:hypothetical protein